MGVKRLRWRTTAGANISPDRVVSVWPQRQIRRRSSPAGAMLAVRLTLSRRAISRDTGVTRRSLSSSMPAVARAASAVPARGRRPSSRPPASAMTVSAPYGNPKL